MFTYNIYNLSISVYISLGVYPKMMKTCIPKDICTLIFIAALFTIAKILKQPKCPLMDG